MLLQVLFPVLKQKKGGSRISFLTVKFIDGIFFGLCKENMLKLHGLDQHFLLSLEYKLPVRPLGKQTGLPWDFRLPHIPLGQCKDHKSLCRACRIQFRIDPVKKGKQISCYGHIKFFDVVMHQAGKYGYQRGSGVRLFLVIPPLWHILLCTVPHIADNVLFRHFLHLRNIHNKLLSFVDIKRVYLVILVVGGADHIA